VLLDRLQSIPFKGIALDTETWVIQPGMLMPPLVCGSAGWLEAGQRVNGILLLKQATLEAFARALDDPEVVIVGANIAYDLGVIATELARMGFDVMPHIFRAFEDGRIYDLSIAEALNAIAEGMLGKDPRTGNELKNPETGKRGSYSLSMCVDLVLGRKDAKQNDEYRTRYAELEHLPVEQWPQVARDYPVEDAKNSAEVALAQIGYLPKTAHSHNWQEITKPVVDEHGRQVVDDKGFPKQVTLSQCVDCTATRLSAPCFVRRPHANLHQVSDQTYSAFCLHLGAAWGFHVDQTKVDKIEAYALRRRGKLIQPFLDAGIVYRDDDGTLHEDQCKLKRLVAIAYGATQPCPHCAGTGKIPSPTQKPIRCTDCKGYCLPTAKDGPKCRAWREATGGNCGRCSNTGMIPHPNPKMINCIIKGAKATEDEEGEDDVKTCDGTGLVLPHAMPRTDGDGVPIGRDPLAEAGDEFLLSLAVYKDDAKVLKDYIPYLRTARVCVNCNQPGTEKKPHAEGCTSTMYRDIPLTLRPNVVLETMRVSYIGGYIQLFPRKPGFIDKHEDGTEDYIPSLRECIVARGPDWETVEVPDDYALQPGEYVC